MKKFVLSLLLVMVVVVLVGCGGGSKPADTKLEETTENQTTEKETAENSTETDLSKLVIVTEDYPPTNYLDENGKLAGTASEAVKVALEKLGLDESIVKVQDWNKSYDMALNNENTLIYTINRIPEREGLFKWIAPVSYDNVYLYKLKTNKGVTINNLDDAKKYKIATVSQDFIEQTLIGKGFELGENAISCQSQRAAMEAVFEGKADAFMVASDANSLDKLLEGSDMKMSDMDTPIKMDELTTVGYIAAGMKTSDDIVNKFKEAMPVVENK